MVKRAIVKRKADMDTKPEHQGQFESAFKATIAALNFKEVNIKAMLKNMSKDDIKEMNQYFNHGKDKFEVKMEKLADYCAEIQTIKIAQDKMEHAKVTMMNTFMDSAVQQYSKESGEWDIQLFKRHLASAADDDDVKM